MSETFSVGNDSGGEAVSVTRDGDKVVVRWGCVDRSFTVEDLRDRLRNIEHVTPFGIWLADRDSGGYRYAAQVEGATFHADDGDGEHLRHNRTIAWDDLLAALMKALADPKPKRGLRKKAS